MESDVNPNDESDPEFDLTSLCHEINKILNPMLPFEDKIEQEIVNNEELKKYQMEFQEFKSKFDEEDLFTNNNFTFSLNSSKYFIEKGFDINTNFTIIENRALTDSIYQSLEHYPRIIFRNIRNIDENRLGHSLKKCKYLKFVNCNICGFFLTTLNLKLDVLEVEDCPNFGFVNFNIDIVSLNFLTLTKIPKIRFEWVQRHFKNIFAIYTDDPISFISSILKMVNRLDIILVVPNLDFINEFNYFQKLIN